MSKLVVFDRDGTLILDRGYQIDPYSIIWSPGALLTIAWPKRMGFKVAVATNQSGIARGYFTLSQVHLFHASMDAKVQSEGGRIDAYTICPHLVGGPMAAYAIDCNCRKPKPELIKQLLQKFQMTSESAIMIGDRESDLLAGQAAGVESFLYDGGDLFEFTQRVISAHFDSVAFSPAKVTSKASRS